MANVPEAFVTEVAKRVVNFIVNSTVKNWRYYKFNKYVERVGKNVTKLEAVAVDEEQEANAAKWRGKLTGGYNGWWEDQVNDIMSNNDKILIEAEEVKKAFWKGRFKVFKRVGLSKKAEKLDADIAKLLNEGQKYIKGDHGVVPVARLPAVAVHNNDLESRKILMEDVLKALQKDQNYVVGIWGMVGVGKTMLADEVVARVLEENLFEAAVKVVVSKDLNIPEIQSVIVKNLSLTLEENDEVGIARRLQSALVNGSKILVLLDDVWNEVPLHEVGLPLHGKQNGCKVLVTSRNSRTLWTMEAEETFEVKPLSNPEARQLFKIIARVFPEGDIADKVADECGGLPLAINTVARALGGRERPVWENALHQLNNSTAPEEFKMEERVYLPIKVSYNLLEGQSKAQQLLLLCCLFPERADIPIAKLVRYVKGLQWLYISDSLENTSHYVFTLLDNLKNYSFLFSGDKDATVKMNHVVRAVCLSILSKEVFRLRVEHMPKLKEWPDHKEQQQHYTGISLTFDDQVQQLRLPHCLDYPELQLLQLQFHGKCLNLPEDFFEAMKKVRVLDFKRMTLRGKFIRVEALVQIISFLTELRTLCLEFFDLSNGDSSSIGSLNHLEVLSFFCSKIDCLPIQIQQLTNLKLLDLRCFGPLIIPSNVLPTLIKLEELYLGNYDSWLPAGTVQSGEGSDISITELSKLPVLRVLQVRVKYATLLLELNEEAWFERLENFHISAIRKVISFREYAIGKSITLDGIIWSSLLDSKIHKIMKITECLTLKSTSFSNLFGVCSDLKTLDLYGSDVKYILETGDSVATLNKLKHIDIQSMDDLIAICEKDLPSESLINLESIKLDNLPELTYLWRAPLGSGCLVNLRLLDMSYCDAITFVFPFSVAIGLVQLEKLDIRCCDLLEWIVSTEENGITGEEIVLPKLSYLSLDDLPVFRSFFPDSAVNTSIETGAQVDEDPIASENAENHEKRGCSWFSLKRKASHTRKPPAINGIRLSPSNGVTNQVPQVLEDNIEENNPLNQLVELPSMNKLMIRCIKNMKHIVDDKTSKESVSKIKIMCVTWCVNLLSLAESEHSIRSLQNLEQVRVENCASMKTLFDFGKHYVENPSTEAILNNLETIILLHLNKLNHVFWMVPEATSCFGNLKLMEISDCGSLKCIFSVSIAKMLGKLEDLKVRNCAMVEEIIEADGGNTEESDLIKFSCLRVLQLDNLDSISSFSSGNDDFDFPSLQDMLVQKCPTMKIFCSGQVKARKLHQVRVTDQDPYQQVPVKDGLNQTIIHLHADSQNTNRPNLVSDEIEEL